MRMLNVPHLSANVSRHKLEKHHGLVYFMCFTSKTNNEVG